MTKRRNNKKMRFMAIILAALLLLTMAPTVFASSLNTEDEPTALTGADILYEDLTKREKYAKHFVTGDGSYFAVSYAEQVNYQDENGAWIEVDNTMETDESSGDKSTKNDKFKIKFANKANKDKLVTIKTDEYNVSFGITMSKDGVSYESLSKVKGNEIESLKPNEGKTTKDVQSLRKAKSGIRYNGVYGDEIDIRYTVTHLKLKEDIILNEKTELHSYKVTYIVNNIKDLTVSQQEDGSVRFKGERNKLLFVAEVPYMYDADGKASNDIEVTTVVGDKTVEITYTPSSEWLNAEERAYPVIIDPTVTSEQYTPNVYDTTVYYDVAYNETNRYATSPLLFMGEDYRNYIKIIEAPTVNGIVNGVDLVLRATSYGVLEWYTGGTETVADSVITMKPVTDYWDEYTFTSCEEDFIYYDTMYFGSSTRFPDTLTFVNDEHGVTEYYTQKTHSEYYNNESYPATITLPIQSTLCGSGYAQYFANYNGFELVAPYFMNIRIASSENESLSYCPILIVRYNYYGPVSPGSSNDDVIEENAEYRISTYDSMNYLTYSSTSAELTFDVFDETDTESQKIILNYSTTDNTYKIKLAKFDKFISANSTSNNLVLTSQSSEAAQWIILPYIIDGVTYYQFVSENEGIALTNPSLNIITCDYFYERGITEQLWYIEQYHEILNVNLDDYFSTYDDYTGVATSENLTAIHNVVCSPGTKYRLRLWSSYNSFSNFESLDPDIVSVDSKWSITIHGAGETTLTFWDNYYYCGVERTVLIKTSFIDNTITMDEDSIYYLSSASNSNNKLSISATNGSSGKKTEFLSSDTNIKTMWRFEHYGNNVYYIYSMTENYPHGCSGQVEVNSNVFVTEYNQMLMATYNSSAVATPSLEVVDATNDNIASSNHNGRWSVVDLGNNKCKIVLADSPDKCITRTDAGIVLTTYEEEKSDWYVENGDYTIWGIMRDYDSTLYNYGDYTTLENSTSFDITLDGEWNNGEYISTWDFDVVSLERLTRLIGQWQDIVIDSRIVINFDPIPVSARSYEVRLKMAGSSNNAAGFTEIYVNNKSFSEMSDQERIAAFNMDWDKAVVWIYNTGLGVNFSNRSEYVQDSIILHETGHALRLEHNISNEYEENILNNPNQPNCTYQNIMYPAFDSEKAAMCVTNFDKIALKFKWGEYSLL